MATLAAVLNWRLKTPFYYGWLVLGMSFLASFSATSVSQVVMGGIQVFIIEDTGWDRSTLAFAVSLGTWASGLLNPFVGWFADRHGPRWLMPAASIVAAIALFWLAGGTAVWHFFFAYILGRAVSNSTLIGIVPRTLAVNFFRRHRNIALSLISEARPIGGAILIQIIALIATHYSWRTAYQYLGILSLVMVLPLIIIMRRRPEDIGLLPDGAKPEESASGGGAAAQGERQGRRRWLSSVSGGPEFDWKAKEALRTRAFWFVAITALLATAASSALGFSLVPYLIEDGGLSPSQATWVLSFGTVLVIANVGWALFANRFTPRVCLMAAMLSGAAIILFLLFVRSVPMAFIFALLWGIGHGSVGSLEHMILAQFFGRASYGTIIGTLAPLQSLALGLGPSLSAVARDLTGNYMSLFVVLMSAHLLAALLVFFVRPPTLPARAAAGIVARAK